MRASRRTVVVLLLLGAALAVAPAALSASSSSRGQAPHALGVLDQAWQLVGRVAGWFGGSQVDEGGSLDPNGKANHGRIHPGAGRPASGMSPDEGGSLDPNGGAAPHRG
jgi:hypothetical protein